MKVVVAIDGKSWATGAVEKRIDSLLAQAELDGGGGGGGGGGASRRVKTGRGGVYAVGWHGGRGPVEVPIVRAEWEGGGSGVGVAVVGPLLLLLRPAHGILVMSNLNNRTFWAKTFSLISYYIYTEHVIMYCMHEPTTKPVG
jgi:hypothetical protein